MDPLIERKPGEAESRVWDLLVVGGGIYGATLALEAARQGLAALVVERGDFGGKTTWNSLRIVHGGLRYLQRLDFPRFHESVRERRWFLQGFPGLVRPLPCLMPLYDPPRGGALRRPTVLRLALRINDFLSRERALPLGRLLSFAQTEELFPMVDRAGLRGGALWYDAVAPDPRQLVVEILRRACRSGAAALERVEASEMLVERGRAAGIRAVDKESGRVLTFQARAVANCAGPWCREVARRLDRDVPGLFRPALAFNLLLDREPLSRATLAVASEEPGAQTWFLLPWEGRLLAGTAYAPVSRGSSGEEGPDEAQIGGFLAALNAALPGFSLRSGEVLDILWGRLPAVVEGGTALASRPVVFDHGAAGGPSGLVSVSGVKLTTARAVAERALAALFRKDGRPAPSAPLAREAALEGRSA